MGSFDLRDEMERRRIGMLHFGLFEIRTDMFVLLLSVLLLFVQLFLCFNVKKKWIRLLPVCLFFLLTVTFIVLSFVFEGWDSFGFFFLAICSIVLLFVCGISWCIWWLVNRRRKN